MSSITRHMYECLQPAVCGTMLVVTGSALAAHGGPPVITDRLASELFQSAGLNRSELDRAKECHDAYTQSVDQVRRANHELESWVQTIGARGLVSYSTTLAREQGGLERELRVGVWSEYLLAEARFFECLRVAHGANDALITEAMDAWLRAKLMQRDLLPFCSPSGCTTDLIQLLSVTSPNLGDDEHAARAIDAYSAELHTALAEFNAFAGIWGDEFKNESILFAMRHFHHRDATAERRLEETHARPLAIALLIHNSNRRLFARLRDTNLIVQGDASYEAIVEGVFPYLRDAAASKAIHDIAGAGPESSPVLRQIRDLDSSAIANVEPLVDAIATSQWSLDFVRRVLLTLYRDDEAILQEVEQLSSRVEDLREQIEHHVGVHRDGIEALLSAFEAKALPNGGNGP